MPALRKRLLQMVMMVLLAGLSGLLSCAPAPAAVEIAADGALQIPARDSEIRLRAYRPDVEIILAWEEEEGGPIQIVVENIAASTEVKVIPEAGQQAASCTVVSETTACLALSLKGSGRQRLLLSPPEEAAAGTPFFAVVGDSQGRNEVLAEVVKAVNMYEVDFLICLGDLVASGTEEEYRAFQETMAELNCPYYTVLGNHDIRGGGALYYRSRLAPEEYCFDYGGFRFVFLDSSSLGLSDAKLSWLQENLTGASPGFVFLHVPPVDPREKDHAFLDPGQAEAFVEIVSHPSSRAEAVFAGHIHMFHHRVISGVHYVVSGGGAPLYAADDEGGYYHFALCRPAAEGLQVEPVKIDAPPRPEELVVNGPSGDCIFSPEELDRYAVLEKELSFQNQLGNYAGEGLYRGVPVSTLIEQAGGMKPGDTLMVYALDGYAQAFAYENVYPENCGWEERQGIMALAVEFNGLPVPEWQEGYRIAFFTEDGVYDNEDCALTSAEGQGWHLYESAGGRWVKTVVRLEVISE